MAFNERRGSDRKQAWSLAGSDKRGQTCPDQSTCVNGTCANGGSMGLTVSFMKKGNPCVVLTSARLIIDRWDISHVTGMLKASNSSSSIDGDLTLKTWRRTPSWAQKPSTMASSCRCIRHPTRSANACIRSFCFAVNRVRNRFRRPSWAGLACAAADDDGGGPGSSLDDSVVVVPPPLGVRLGYGNGGG